MTAGQPRQVYRVRWTPGGDVLDAHCFCGADATLPDPVTVWTWLLDHPRHAAPAPEGEPR